MSSKISSDRSKRDHGMQKENEEDPQEDRVAADLGHDNNNNNLILEYVNTD